MSFQRKASGAIAGILKISINVVYQMCDLVVNKLKIFKANVKQDIKVEFVVFANITGLELVSTIVLNVSTMMILITL